MSALPRIVSTLPWSRRKAWRDRVQTVQREGSWVSVLRRVVSAAQDADALIIDGASGGSVRLIDFGAAAVLARRSSGPAVIIAECAWSTGTGAADRLANQVGIRALDSPRVTYAVLAKEELSTFPRTWGVPPERVAFTPYLYNATEEDLAIPPTEEGGVFAGGNSLRDYGPLLEAARTLPLQVDLATRRVPPEVVATLPGHVRAGQVPHARFVELMRQAKVVVVALAITNDRSAGQQTFLNAMAMGKLVIATDVMGVRDYIEPMRTGIVVPPRDAGALREAILWAIDPSHRDEVRAIKERGQERALSFHNPEAYVARVVAAADASVARLRGRTPAVSNLAAP